MAKRGWGLGFFLVWGAGTCGLLPACTGKESRGAESENWGSVALPENKEQTAAQPEDLTAPAGQEVTLLDAGTEPRTVLRYTHHAGDVLKLRMRTKVQRSIKMGTRSAKLVLPIQVDLQISTLEVDTSGTARRRSRFSNFTLLDMETEGVTQREDARRLLEKKLSNLEVVTIDDFFDARGFVRQVEVEGGAEPDPDVESLMQSLREELEQSSEPWPKEAVGVGARWRSVKKVTSEGALIDHVETTRLTLCDGGIVETESEYSESASPQQLTLPDGSKVTLASFRSSGKSSRRTRLNPVGFREEDQIVTRSVLPESGRHHDKRRLELHGAFPVRH